MDYSSLTLSRNTLERVNMLMNRDFIAFKEVKSQDLLTKSRNKIVQFFAKKSFLYAGLFLLAMVAPNIETSVAAAEIGEEKTFIVTAYYSPLPNQEKYYRGSYEADVKLNGEGIKASDGTPVFVGMIAAPKNYEFGTKIALDGLGVVSVHDRGGAIVSSANGVAYDRIDIWMGYGDEGLERTLAWGRREITGKIVDKNTPVSLDLANIVKNAPQVTQAALQKLQTLGYETAGKTFAEVILDFQLKNGVIASVNDAGAGNYGPKTTAKLNELYNNYLKTGTKPAIHTEKVDEKIITQNTENSQNFAKNSQKKMTEVEARELAQNMKLPVMGNYAIGVVNLQNFLKDRGFFKDEVDGIMDIWTIGALRAYQHSHNQIQTGRTDIRTQQFIIADLMK